MKPDSKFPNRLTLLRMDRFRLANIVLLIAGAGLVATGAAMLLSFPRPAAPDQLPPDGPALMAEAGRIVRERNCNFCHRTERPADLAHARDNCQLCHQYKERPEHLAPPLEKIAERRPEEWIRRYLRYPYKLREHSSDRMPDMQLSDREVHVLTRYLGGLAETAIESLPPTTIARETAPSAERLAQGSALYEKFSCAQCHTLGTHKAVLARDFTGKLAVPAARFAPSLDKAWNRTRPQWLVAAIMRPDKWMPWAQMPPTGMTEKDAELLAWYVLNAVADPQPSVTNEEVQAILTARCASCHYGPDENARDSRNPAGGAGWIATWGKARKLDLTSMEGLLRGAVDDHGNPRPTAVAFAENSPLLMHIRGHKQPAMPFGADALPAEEIDKLERWVLAGGGSR